MPFEQALAEAQDVQPGDFPAVGGRTLQEIADTVQAGPKLGLASSVFVPGDNRLAFGVIDTDNSFVYGPTAVYVARSPEEKAAGPFPAPADPLVVDPPFRSAGVDEDIAAIYSAAVPLERPGEYSVLVTTRTPRQGIVAASAQIEVTRDSEIPEPGDAGPAVSTDTLASVGGDIEQIETRVPPDDMHSTDFADVLGRRPVALLFATPQLCQTRVCGPVTDIAQQLKGIYGDRVEFIHQEVYVDNQIEQGLRRPLEKFELQTEPWLFTFDREGRVAARLEGSFGVNEFRDAVEAAL